MMEHNTTRLLLLLISIIVLSLFLTIVFNPQIITNLYNDIVGQQLDVQKSSEAIKVVNMLGLR